MMYFILGLVIGICLGVLTMGLLRMGDDERCADVECQRRV